MNRKATYPMTFAAAAIALFVTHATVRASETDDKIESAFENSYVYQTYLQDDAIKSDANEGVLTLTGSVNQESHKTLAQDTAASIPGVTRVDNQLATKAEAAADSADTAIARKVKLTLLFHRNVDAGNTTVDVQDGVVTLTGSANSIAQKELSGEYAADIDGVKDVRNELMVQAMQEKPGQTPAQKVDDASITAQVKSALLAHRSTSATRTTVVTLDGEVTLTGIAKNSAEKALVTKLVNDIQGVTGVKNQMTIAEVARIQ